MIFDDVFDLASSTVLSNSKKIKIKAKIMEISYNLRGDMNLSGKSLSNFSRETSAIGPNNMTGLVKPGCFRTTLSYAGNLETVSENNMSSQCSFPRLLDRLFELRRLLKKLPLDSFADISFLVALN